MATLLTSMAHSGERIKYLSLALEARGAIKRLKSLLETKNRTPELTSALQAAVNSLKTICPPTNLYSKLHDEKVSYSSFEEIQTLHEVSRMLDEEELKTRLERILTREDFKVEDVQGAIKFFSAIENRALYHYNDPSLAETSR